jgi:hypothetical protein
MVSSARRSDDYGIVSRSREPDPPHGHLGGMAGGSLADDGWSQESAALVEHDYSMI